MEIYNEALRDLLSSDSAPLRLLDDPEVNIVFDGSASKVQLEEDKHSKIHFCSYFDREGLLLTNLRRRLWGIGTIYRSSFPYVKVRVLELVCISMEKMTLVPRMWFCILAAQRQIGETALNETSSRSHQILRLVCLPFNGAPISYIIFGTSS